MGFYGWDRIEGFDEVETGTRDETDHRISDWSRHESLDPGTYREENNIFVREPELEGVV